MADRKGRTFTDHCSECGTAYHATNILGAQNQAASCYDSHFKSSGRDLKDVLQDLRDHLGDEYPG